jgi:hypothetical protein
VKIFVGHTKGRKTGEQFAGRISTSAELPLATFRIAKFSPILATNARAKSMYEGLFRDLGLWGCLLIGGVSSLMESLRRQLNREDMDIKTNHRCSNFKVESCIDFTIAQLRV